MRIFQCSLKEKHLLSAALSLLLLFFSVSLNWNQKLEWQDVMHTEQVNVVFHPRIPQLTDVANNAMIDKTIKRSDGTIVVEGWTTWDRNFNKSLHVYTEPGTGEMSAYAYKRSDLSGRAGAKGFFLIVESTGEKDTVVCVMNMIGVNYYSVLGSAC